jgi:hypothetical protein
MRLMEGADIYQIAKNCRTSVEMIEKFYAAHIKNTLDAVSINVMRQRRSRASSEVSDQSADTASSPQRMSPTRPRPKGRSEPAHP